MMKLTKYRLLLGMAMAASLPLVGCGGGGIGTSGLVQGAGSVAIKINWPSKGRIIPDRAQFIRLVFRIERLVGTNWVADAAALQDRTVGDTVTQVLFEDLPEATGGTRLTLTAETRESAGTSTVILSSASQTVAVVAGEVVSVQMTLASTVKQLMIEATGGVTSPPDGYAGVNAGPFALSPRDMATFRVRGSNDPDPMSIGDGDTVPINFAKVQVQVQSGDLRLKNRTTGQLVNALNGLETSGSSAGVFDVVAVGPNPGTIGISTTEGTGTDLNFTPKSIGTLTVPVTLVAAPPSPIDALQAGYTGTVQDVCLFLNGTTGPRAVQALLRNRRAVPLLAEKSRLGKQNNANADSVLNNYRDVAAVDPGVTDNAGNGRLCREITGLDTGNPRVLAVRKGTANVYETFTGSVVPVTGGPVNFNDLASADGTPAFALGVNGRLFQFSRSPLRLADIGTAMVGQDLTTTIAPWNAQTYVYVRSNTSIKRFRPGNASPDALLGTLGPGVIDIASDGHFLFTLTSTSLELRSWNGALISQTPVTGGKRVSASNGTVVVATVDEITRYTVQQ